MHESILLVFIRAPWKHKRCAPVLCVPTAVFTMNFLTLNINAIVAALAMGIGLIWFGQSMGVFFFGVMFWFVLLSAMVTLAGKRFKQNAGLYEKSRGVRNVVANGMWPLIMSALFYAALISGHIHYELFAALGFVSSVAAVTSDTFSSELGVLDGQPVMLLTLKKVHKGTSGGVTWLGLVAGFAGSALVAAMMLAVLPELHILGLNNALPAFIAVVLGGFAGTLVDSVLGYFEEKGIGNKYTSNFFGSIGGSLICLAVAVAIGI